MFSEWPAFLACLKTLWPSLLSAFKLLAAGKAGQVYQQGKDAQDALERLDEVADAGADMRNRTFDERVQFLRQRGRVRDLPK